MVSFIVLYWDLQNLELLAPHMSCCSSDFQVVAAGSEHYLGDNSKAN